MLKRFFSRKKEITPVNNDVVADLDKLMVHPISVKLFGKERVIKPLEVGEFLLFVSRFATIVDNKNRSPEQIIEEYYKLVRIACDDITYEEVTRMSQEQIAALLTLVIETVTGKIYGEKKTLQQVKLRD